MPLNQQRPVPDTRVREAASMLSGAAWGTWRALNRHNSGFISALSLYLGPREFPGKGFGDAPGRQYCFAPVVAIPAQLRISHKDN